MRFSLLVLGVFLFILMTSADAHQHLPRNRNDYPCEVAFSASEGLSSRYGLYVLDVNTFQIRQLHQQSGNDFGMKPIWSHDGQKIAFFDEQNNLNVINADGSGKRILVESLRYPFDLVWSPDDTSLVYVASEDTEDNFDSKIYSVNLEDGTPNLLIDTPGDFRSPRFSPDGTLIVFSIDLNGVRHLGLANSNGGNVRLFVRNSYRPLWSPDGSQVLFLSDRTGSTDLYIIGVDGDNLHNLTNDSAHEFVAEWSPDGSQVMFSSNGKGNYDVYILNLDTGAVYQVNEDSDNNYLWASWSPDGVWIAYEGTKRFPGAYLVLTNLEDLITFTDIASDLTPDGEYSWSPLCGRSQN